MRKGAIILMAVVLLLFLGCNENAKKALEMSNISLTRVNMQHVITGLEIFQVQKGYFPSDLQKLLPDYVPSAGVFKDAWGNELVYTTNENAGDFQLVSKGKDRLINTPDDIVFANGKFTMPGQ
jgi:type II secretory pathway pseudopilin PulG